MRTLWQPLASSSWDPFQQFQNEFGRLFGRGGNGLMGRAAFPLLNVWEEGEEVVVEAELPGLAIEDLDITVTGGNELTLKGERKRAEQSATWHRQERPFGSFTRTVALPFLVDPEKVDARLEHGVLRVKLAKHESAKPRKITVKAS